ncbi:SDR family oxidoreductase [Pseudonocardia sp. NPDC049154]|uniref:SDR family oxidoreductase n=1 Tax=Pseudonocardia sp. NPDC049154 TaxID=3155501 RepID=UPI0033F3B06E
MAMLPSDAFRDRVCVVTGGTSGIGKGIALGLARLGGTVVVLGRNQDRIDATLDEAAGLAVHALPLDVRVRADVERVFAEVTATHGVPTALVNAAAGNFRCAPEELSPNGWAAITDIVLDGTWHCTQVFARGLLAAGLPGAVVSIGSSKAHTGGADTVPSAAAKAGVVAVTKSLAAAWGGRGIRLNIVSPGVTAGTGAIEQLFAAPGSLETDLAKVPLGRHTTLEEIVDAVSYLLSDYASGTTGAELSLDGGRSLGIG